MTRSTTPSNVPVIVVPNWNGKDGLAACLDSLESQTIKAHIIVVDNGSRDGSIELIESRYPNIELIKHDTNKGYAGGVNPGFKSAIELKAPYVAPFNNDAVADKYWLEELVRYLDEHSAVGAAACKLLSADGEHLDSTGDYYTNWGLPYPRGRGETDTTKYDTDMEIFAASGGASLYRVSMLEEIGLLDEDFFAYYEDVDLSFRAQLAGWKVAYVPSSVVYHDTGSTSRRIKGFTTYQTMKNQPLVLYKNVPRRYLFSVGWRFFLAHSLFFGRAISRGQGWPALKGDAKATAYFFTKYGERRHIQKTKKVSDEYIWSIMVHDLPPNALALRKLRTKWWKITGKTQGEKSL
jgi:GT2 family glycosyltransferase